MKPLNHYIPNKVVRECFFAVLKKANVDCVFHSRIESDIAHLLNLVSDETGFCGEWLKKCVDEEEAKKDAAN